MTNDITVVILAAGLGTRMKSNKAKVLHQAGGDTLLNHVIRAGLQLAAPERIIAVVGHQAEQVRQSVPFPGIRFAEQTEQKGTGHAVLCARTLAEAGGQLLILNGDGPLLKPETLLKLVSLTSGGGALVTTRVADPAGYGRITRDPNGNVAAIVEHKSATPAQLTIQEINAGVYCFHAAYFWAHISQVTPNNAAGEYYLTDMVDILTRAGYPIAPLLVEDETELLGINTKVELAVADNILRQRKARALMLAGVTIENPASVAIDVDVEAGSDTTIEANVQLRGKTKIGSNCRIGAGSMLRDCLVADNAVILPYVVAQDSRNWRECLRGPFSRLRMQADAADRSYIGNFVELKKTRLGVNSKASHLTYLGDTEIGADTNIGAGTITCNYDGLEKHRTLIGDGVFVGSNSTLVAPINLEAGSFIAAGSVITKPVSADSLAIGRAQQTEKPGWAKRRRQMKQASPKA